MNSFYMRRRIIQWYQSDLIEIRTQETEWSKWSFDGLALSSTKPWLNILSEEK